MTLPSSLKPYFIIPFLLIGLLQATGTSIVHEEEWGPAGKSREFLIPVESGGDYQIGLAWIEVLSGNPVRLEIGRKNGKITKAVVAPVGEVTRFETRLEELGPGEDIRIKATAYEARYRLGFKVAIATPAFDGLPVFRVSEFGAVGDGVTDDMKAIHAAVHAAERAGGGIVDFDGLKTYRVVGLRGFNVESVISLVDAKNIAVRGNGAKLLLHPPDRFAYLDNVENVQLDGFLIDYLPLPYYQGSITDIDLDKLTIDIQVPDRYPVPEVGRNTYRTPFFGRSFIPDAEGSRSGHGHNIYIEEVTRLESDRHLRLHVRTSAAGSDTPDAQMISRVSHAKVKGATEFVVPHVKYGHRGGVTRISRSTRVKLSNLRFSCVPYFWMNIRHNTGPITLSNVDLKMLHPETELLASWRDGLHIKNGRWGILIEDADLDGAAMYDDTFAIYSRAQEVVGFSDNTVTIQPYLEQKEDFLWRKGDWASFWTTGQDEFLGMARVVSVFGDTGKNSFDVTFENLPTELALGSVVLHEESLNRGTLIRNCRTTNVGTENSSTRFRCVDARFERNHFEDINLWFHPATGTYSGPRPRNIVFADNYIESTDSGLLNLDEVWSFSSIRDTFEGLQIDAYKTPKLLIEDSSWIHPPGKILNLRDGSEAWVFGNTLLDSVESGLSNLVTVDPESVLHHSGPSGP